MSHGQRSPGRHRTLLSSSKDQALASVADPHGYPLSSLPGGRLHVGTLAGFSPEWWPASRRNPWPASIGIRKDPEHVAFVPLEQLNANQHAAFELTGTGAGLAGWPEVGSRMTVHLVGGEAMVGGWIVVEPGRYRYSIDWSDGMTVRSVVWEYLATETRWEAAG